MNNSKRYVNIRGYVREVTVCHMTNDGEWVVIDGQRREKVGECQFYHRNEGGLLILRDTPEFKRKYPGHPVAIESL